MANITLINWHQPVLLIININLTLQDFFIGFQLAQALDGRIYDGDARKNHPWFFKDLLIPGLLLNGLGILNASAFIIFLLRNRLGWIFSGLALGRLVIWFIVEIIILREFRWLHARYVGAVGHSRMCDDDIVNYPNSITFTYLSPEGNCQ